MEKEVKEVIKNCKTPAELFENLHLIIGKDINLAELEEDSEEGEQ